MYSGSIQTIRNYNIHFFETMGRKVYLLVVVVPMSVWVFRPARAEHCIRKFFGVVAACDRYWCLSTHPVQAMVSVLRYLQSTDLQ